MDKAYFHLDGCANLVLLCLTLPQNDNDVLVFLSKFEKQRTKIMRFNTTQLYSLDSFSSLRLCQ